MEDSGVIRFADKEAHPFRLVAARFLAAVGVIVLMALVVYLDRHGYRDIVDGDVGLLDAVYYSTVSVTTTGYGDIIPVTSSARLLTTLVVTPLRVAFLVLVVSTTVEVLTTRGRYLFRVQRWRRSLRDHYVIFGYGTKGRSAAESLASRGVHHDQVVVVEYSRRVADEANLDGYVTVVGDCTREGVLRRAGVPLAKGLIVAVDRDDTAVLATLTARILNTESRLVAAVREDENAKLLKRSGASVVVTSDEATGRLLGLAIDSPHQADLVEDLLQIGEGVDMSERDVTDVEVGHPAADGVVGVVRNGRILPRTEIVAAGDRVLTLEMIEDLEEPESIS